MFSWSLEQIGVPTAQERILLHRLELAAPKSAKERFTAALVLGALRSL